LDTLKIKKKQEENATMSIYCPRCRRKNSSRECPLDNISVCGFCTEDHSTEKCPSLPALLVIYRSGDPEESSYAPRRPWKPKNQPTYLDLQSQVPPYYQQQQQQQTVELTRLEKLVYSIPISLVSKMERRT
jgi:hypothetical protein